MNQYEAMFLFDPTFGAAFEQCEAEIRRLMDRAQGEILLCRKWDERRLAFKVKGRKRGVYVLVYFRAAATKIGALERDAQLSENILRLLVLRADGLTLEAMEKAAAARSESRESDADTDAPPRSRPRRSGDRPPRESAGESAREPGDVPESTLVD
ncbi:MAG: 30S ribosomal protein S6 [Planctomycetes bacterium]|nr:30S ribosomal protein S6 [Planctomycetota bacterium]